MANIFLVVFWSVLSLFSHKFYFSLTQAEYNADNKTVECMMQVFIDDLEYSLSTDLSRKVRFEDPDFRPLAYNYIKKHLVLENSLGQSYPVDFIGVELNELDQLLVYFEFGGIDNSAKLEMKNDLFIDFIPEQVNLINYKRGTYSKSLMYKKGDSFFKKLY